MVGEKVKTGFWIEKKVMDSMDELLIDSNSESRSEFVTQALKFYMGFLRTKKAETYLLETMNAAISGTIGGTEERLSRLLYKMCVEVAISNRIIAYDKNISDEQIDEFKRKAELEVGEIIGYWKKN